MAVYNKEVHGLLITEMLGALPGCIIEGGLLTQVQTHAMETLGPINLAVL